MDSEARQIKNLQRALEEERQRRRGNEKRLTEALTLLQKTLKDREKFRNLVEDINAIIFATDQDGIIVYVSPIIHAYTGFRPDECVGLPFLDLVYPDDREHLRKIYPKIVAGQLKSTEYRIRHKRHHFCWVKAFNRPTITEGVFKGLRGVMVDITDRKKAEDAFRDSESKHQAIIESIEEGYFEVDLKGNLTFVNTPLCRIVGFSKSQLLFTNYRQYTSRRTARILFRIFNRVFRTGISLANQDFNATTKGRNITLEISASLVRDRDARPVGFRGMLRDITLRKRAEAELKELERQLYHAQRMEAIGTLAGGIAHDFNNILMGMQGNVSLVQMRMPARNPLTQKLKNVEQYIQNGAGLTRQLLDFARTKPRPTRISDLNFLIHKTARMFGRTKKEIQIDFSGLKATWTVNVDSGQIEQVLVNLYVNAWQAMPGGGDLILTTRNVELNRQTVHPFGMKPGKYIEAAVIDTGIGMDEITRQKIFTPFFTTKERGRGTGLGLSSAYGIIKNHGGFFKVSSRVGRGSKFSIYLPATEAPAEREQESNLEPVHGAGTILVVDDEKFITEITREWLGELGYDVIEAPSGSAAVEIYQERKAAIDLVILDVVMPGMDGGETFERLQSIDPNVRVLLTSGYGFNKRAEEIVAMGCYGFISKPYNILQLSQKIGRLLGFCDESSPQNRQQVE
ncbi:MAG: PAS domain S-box protein [Desulfobacterales bacterium]|nr:PAS domain S-box protein [Desulfobacterales bacterium]